MSARPSSRNLQSKGNIKVGICENHNYTDPHTDQTGDCPKCASGEHLKIEVKRLSDFRCPVCGEKLTLVKQGNSWIKWVILAACLVAICIAIYFLIPKGDKPNIGADTTIIEDSIVIIDNVDNTIDTPKTGDSVALTQPENHQKDSIASPLNKTVLDGTANLITHNNGNQTLKFLRRYRIDLHTFDDQYINIYPNDELRDIKIIDNCVVSGIYHNQYGEERLLSPIKLKL